MQTSLSAVRGNREATIINAEELFGDFSNLSESQDIKDRFESYWEWPEEIGNGIVSTIMPRPGITLETGNFRLHEDIAVRSERTHRSVIFAFSILGNMKYTVNSEKGQNEFLIYRQGHSVMGYLPKGQQNIVRPAMGTRAYYYVHIAIDPLLLKTFLDGQHDQMPIGLHNIVDGAEEQRFYQASIMSPTVNMAIHQIINCPYRSSLKRLFLEGKVLELISYSLAQSVSSTDTMQKKSELRPDDIERALQARNILISNLEEPPSLLALAKQVGTNKTTLNKGFRQTFGTSVFDYLRIRRLEKARELLDSKKVNVCEAAFHVGYTHQSSFARAFKNHFGTIPKDHLH